MRGPVLFIVCLVAGATLGALALKPAPDRGDASLDAATLFGFGPREDDAPRTVVVERQEAVGSAARACVVTGCQLAFGDHRRIVPLVEGEAVHAVEVTVQWQARSAATQRFVVDLLACEPGACSQQAEPLATTAGASPLVLSLALDAPVRVLSLRVGPVDLTPGPSEVYAAPTGQSFTVTGTATLR